VSSEAVPPVATSPGDPDAELTAAVLADLDGADDRLAAFARSYARRMGIDQVQRPAPAALAGQIRSLFAFVDGRRGEVAVRALNPVRESDGYVAAGTVVEANLPDSPFLIDSVGEELRSHGLDVRLVVHPVMGIERAPDGSIAAVGPARGALHRESVMHFEVSRRVPETELASLEEGVARVLGDVRLAVRDFHAMVDHVDRMVEIAHEAVSRYPKDEMAEAIAFLHWLKADNFVFLGYREYEVAGTGADAVVRVVPESGLGVLSDESSSTFAKPVAVGTLKQTLQDRIVGGPLVVVSKTNRQATVHRRVKMDYVGVKRVDQAGNVVGELRMIGLFTSKALMEPARDVPLIRRKLDHIMESEDLFPGSHDYKAVVTIFDSFPKDELFASTAEDVRRTVMALLTLQEKRQVQLFVRPDLNGRFVSATVALPRDHVSTELRLRLQNLLEERFNGESVDYHMSLGETDPARFHFIVHVPEGEIPEVSYAQLEHEVLDAARTWDDALSDALVERYGEVQGHALARRYAGLFPEYYKSATPMFMVEFDVDQFERLGPERPYTVALQNEDATAEPLTRLKLYKTGGKAPLSDLLPVLEALGLTVVEEVPTRLQEHEGSGRYLHDFGVLDASGWPLDLDSVGGLVADTVRAVWDGRAESDSLNRLVPAARLSWRQVAILRAYRQYRQVLGGGFTKRYINDAFVRNSGLARKLVELFELRLDPAREGEGDSAALEEQILRGLDEIASLDDDRILRSFFGMILATVRTNAFKDGGALPYLSFKLRCADVPGMPKPVPRWEIFVYSTAMEGVHLRGGFVARGGIRWSDRLEDYRTEILGLMKAQMVKNAVIVPTGAKGGFVLKTPPSERDALREEERRQYIVLMRGMLDLTDNIAGGEVRRPLGVRVLDTDSDAYLVVAADKGTAHLSDTANEVSAEYGFWLGDAYASGGSAGYDHKALGITAKGAWESVKRHFGELGHDVMTEPFTVIGIGDMSGDVFGNGMLLSPAIRLVAAFDHRHVFIDPDPDPERSIEERRRLFELPSSSWDEYDRSLISAGGGVWPRTAKSVPLSVEARTALGVQAESLSPTELCQAILRAPVDLFWNGGIGTFVKASSESHPDVGDRANDALRVNGGDLRCRVVAEGGNLGFTQNGRIEYAVAGGRINTDAIDNSAGVDCSDHEVNLKILLAQAVESGALTTEQRNELLESVADHVTAHVLYDNYLQVQILSQESKVSAARMEAYESLMEELERAGLLDRQLESLPGSDRMAEREGAGAGMVRPELCVLLAYAKRLLRDQIQPSSLPDDPYLDADLASYFPEPVVERFGDLLSTHPLRREIVATIVTNDVINSMGSTFVARMAAETGAAPDEICRAFLIAREVTGAREHWGHIEGLRSDVPVETAAELMAGLDSMVEQFARWYLRYDAELDLQSAIDRDRPGFRELLAHLQEAATTSWRLEFDERLEGYVTLNVPEDTARFGATVPDLVYAPDVIAVARETGRSIAEVAHAFFVVGERLYLNVVEERVAHFPAKTRWQRLAWGSQLDDLRLLRRQIVARVIEQGAGEDIDAAVDAYLAARVDPYQRLATLMGTTAGSQVDDASAVMVMVHQIRQVVA
jgi:glutamate dehydrogenase